MASSYPDRLIHNHIKNKLLARTTQYDDQTELFTPNFNPKLTRKIRVQNNWYQ